MENPSLTSTDPTAGHKAGACRHHGHQSPNASPNAHGAHGRAGGPLITSASATLHCLTGCIIGEIAGLAIGVSLGLGVWPTIALATTLAYISGFSLGVLPIMRRQNKTFLEALRLIWVGEAISIGVMEATMNAVDYSMGGMTAGSIFAPMFWISIAVAAPAGFLAAWPVNWWLLRADLKKCH